MQNYKYHRKFRIINCYITNRLLLFFTFVAVLIFTSCTEKNTKLSDSHIPATSQTQITTQDITISSLITENEKNIVTTNINFKNSGENVFVSDDEKIRIEIICNQKGENIYAQAIYENLSDNTIKINGDICQIRMISQKTDIGYPAVFADNKLTLNPGEKISFSSENNIYIGDIKCDAFHIHIAFYSDSDVLYSLKTEPTDILI
ncbi:MAG: hypothetical protein E7510_11875 [Ruminococcus sp.]|nr:hypothetical protein [Ruminococcus sp.]MBP1566099.1 hypothetical protein [Oscillospiraceae bacterium]